MIVMIGLTNVMILLKVLFRWVIRKINQVKLFLMFIQVELKLIEMLGVITFLDNQLLINRYYTNESLVKAMYRPYCKQAMYFNQYLNNCVYQMPKIFPNQDLENLVICVTGIGETKEFSALITDVIPNLHLIAGSQCFPLYTYEKSSDLGTLFATATGEYVKKENIPDTILSEFQKIYKDKTISKEDIFYYVYGVLHSPEYKQRFASDLKKMLPRIPYCSDFWAFSKAGR
jgi:predicted helicase